MISYSNIKKKKGQTISLIIMFLIAGMLFNLGMLILFSFGNYFDKLVSELNSSDEYYIIPDKFYNKDVKEFLQNNEYIEKFQIENSIYAMGKIANDNEFSDVNILFNNIQAEREISKLKYVENKLEADNLSVFIPYSMKVDSGYELNDKLTVKIDNLTINLTVKGFIDDIFFSFGSSEIMGLYLPENTYEYVKEELGEEYSVKLVYSNLLENNSDIGNEIREIIDEENIAGTTVVSMNLESVEMLRTILVSVVSIIMIIFSLIISFVCLIIVRFRIKNSIEEDMYKIGSLKAAGFTNNQIISSNVLQSLITSTTGLIMGIAVSYFMVPILSDIFSTQSGFNWTQDFDFKISGITFCSIVFIVIGISFLASYPIKKLTPVNALKGGVSNHNFNKNKIPLSKTKGSMPLILAKKYIFNNIRQSMTIMIILVFVSFASSFAFILFYNTTINTRTFAEVPGFELANVSVVLKEDVDKDALLKEISNLKDVRKAQFFDYGNVNINDYNAFAIIMNDFSERETDTIYDGRYPIHKNEIAIAGNLAKTLEKTIGDSVILEKNDREKEFLITGLTQGIAFEGIDVSILRESFLILDKEFEKQNLFIYLEDNVKSKDFIDELERKFDDIFENIEDKDKSLEEGMEQFSFILTNVGIAIIIFTVLVIILFLYFIINTSIIRRRKEIGIQKALGYSNIQLMNQISLGFIPMILLGIIIGSVIGITQTNNLMSIAQKSAEISKANYIITPFWIFVLNIGIVVISYFTSMIITFKIRKISVYSLINE
jgi:putative ABC transport system permease protein